MLKFPSELELNTAIAWLRSNNGDCGESERCNAVADWLEAKEKDNYIKNAARKAGVPLKLARQRIGS